MKIACNRSAILAGLAALLVAASAPAQQAAKQDKASQALQERERAMAQLAADSKQALERLKGLTAEQKNAVVALMAITRASALYESRFLRPDDAALRALYGPLREFSPAYKAPADFHQAIMMACFDQTVACLSAQKKCQEAGRSSAECERRFDVIQACGNEMACFTAQFFKLHKGVPTILGGRDPFPPGPQPFPY